MKKPVPQHPREKEILLHLSRAAELLIRDIIHPNNLSAGCILIGVWSAKIIATLIRGISDKTEIHNQLSDSYVSLVSANIKEFLKQLEKYLCEKVKK